MMIDLSLKANLPTDILDLLAESAAETRREKDVEHAAHLDGSHRNNSPVCPVYNRTREFLEGVLRELDIRAFHCARLVDPYAVRRNGLEVLSPATVKNRVLKALKQAGVQESLLTKARGAFENCEQAGGYEQRKGLLWFVLSSERTDDSGCTDFFRYFGGEITRHALHNLSDELFPILASIGTPCVVEARLSIRDAMPHHLSALADDCIRLGWHWFLDNKYTTNGCDMMMKNPVMPNRILDVWTKNLPNHP